MVRAENRRVGTTEAITVTRRGSPPPNTRVNLPPLPEAQLAHAQAHVLAPKSPIHLAFLASAVKREMPDWHRVQVDLGQFPEARATKQP